MNVNDMFHLFNRTIKNILHNFIPHEMITCDDRVPPWISTRRLIQNKKEAYKRFKRSNFETLKVITSKIFSPFRNYWGFPLKRYVSLRRDITLIYENGNIHKSQNLLVSTKVFPL